MPRVKHLITNLEVIYFSHIYKEYNTEVDHLLKKGIGAFNGVLHYEVFRDEDFLESKTKNFLK